MNITIEKRHAVVGGVILVLLLSGLLWMTSAGSKNPDRLARESAIRNPWKVMGTVHVAFGDNKSMGGTVRVASHLDGLVTSPAVWFEDRMVMEQGRLLE